MCWLQLTLSSLLRGRCRASGYDEGVKHNFLRSYIPAVRVPIPPPLSKYCHCVWNAVSADIPFDEFFKFDSGEVAINANATLNRRGTTL